MKYHVEIFTIYATSLEVNFVIEASPYTGLFGIKSYYPKNAEMPRDFDLFPNTQFVQNCAVLLF